jgi:MazG family protein
MADSGKEFERLLQLVAQLRAEDGCPWDREQTPSTIKRYLVEEVYEVVDAVEHRTADHVAEELGDLIFMAVFLGNLYREAGQFQMDQVLRRVAEKMVRRHPHVFGDRKVDSSRQVKLNWDEIKRQEKPNKSLGIALNEISRALPALMRANRILSRLGRALHRSPNEKILRSQLQETLSPLLQHGANASAAQSAAVAGKILLLLVALWRLAEISPEEALLDTLDRFCQQLEHLEASLFEEGNDWQDLSVEQETALWDHL